MSSSPPPPHSCAAPLIIAPQLENFLFGEHFLLHLFNQLGGDAKISVLISPLAADGIKVPHKLGPFLEEKRLHIAFGSCGNKQLIKRIVDQNKINAVFMFVDDHNNTIDTTTTPPHHYHQQIVPRTRQYLTQLCSLLESLRQCANPPTLVPIFFASSPSDFVIAKDGQLSAIVQCQSQASVRFSSAFALFHSFAISYRLNIQIALMLANPDAATMDSLWKLAQKEGGKATINHIEGVEQEREGQTTSTNDSNKSNGIPVGRMLIFGTKAAIERARCMGPELRELMEESHVQLMVAETKPGLDEDERVEEEVLAKGASHVGYAAGADDETMALWESGGPAQLRDNVRQNLFTPWLLRQISAKFGIRFMVFNQKQCSDDAKMGESRYGVVRHFDDKLAQLMAEDGINGTN